MYLYLVLFHKCTCTLCTFSFLTSKCTGCDIIKYSNLLLIVVLTLKIVDVESSIQHNHCRILWVDVGSLMWDRRSMIFSVRSCHDISWSLYRSSMWNECRIFDVGSWIYDRQRTILAWYELIAVPIVVVGSRHHMTSIKNSGLKVISVGIQN